MMLSAWPVLQAEKDRIFWCQSCKVCYTPNSGQSISAIVTMTSNCNEKFAAPACALPACYAQLL